MATPNMGLDLPTLGGDPSVWDDKINAFTALIDSHDHTIGKGVQLGSAALNLITDLTLHGTAALTNAKALAFTGQAAYAVAKSLFVKTADNELYWRTNAGVDVKITAGASLNMSLVGGIYGDYSSTAAKIYYEDAGKRYKMLQSGPGPDFWAAVDCGDLKLYEKASGIANAVTHKSPAALAAGYSVTWPAALPAATALLQGSVAGVLAFNAAAARCAAYFSTLDASGAASFSSTVALGTQVAAFTATAAITATDFKHTTARKLEVPAQSFATPNGSTARLSAVGWGYELLLHTGSVNVPSCVAPIEIDIGMVITQIDFYVANANAGVVVRFKKHTAGAGGNGTSVGNATIVGGSASIAALAETITQGTQYWLQVEGMGTTGDVVEGANVYYTRP